MIKIMTRWCFAEVFKDAQRTVNRTLVDFILLFSNLEIKKKLVSFRGDVSGMLHTAS